MRITANNSSDGALCLCARNGRERRWEEWWKGNGRMVEADEIDHSYLHFFSSPPQSLSLSCARLPTPPQDAKNTHVDSVSPEFWETARESAAASLPGTETPGGRAAFCSFHPRTAHTLRPNRPTKEDLAAALCAYFANRTPETMAAFLAVHAHMIRTQTPQEAALEAHGRTRQCQRRRDGSL